MQERIPQSIAKRIVFKAFLSSDHVTAAGAALTIPVQISKNGAGFANLATPANATSTGNGWYYIDLAAADTGTLGPLIVRGTEATIDPVELICEIVAATNAGFTALPAAAADAAGGLPISDAGGLDLDAVLSGNVPQTGDAFAIVDDPTTGNVAIKTSTGAIETILSGITSLAGWLRGLFRKDAMNAGSKIEVNSGGGTFNEVTDSIEAIRDRGDAAWITATSVTVSDKTGFSLSATGADAILKTSTFALALSDAVWDEVLNVGHAVANSAAVYLSNLNADWAEDGRLDVILDSLVPGSANNYVVDINSWSVS